MLTGYEMKLSIYSSPKKKKKRTERRIHFPEEEEEEDPPLTSSLYTSEISSAEEISTTWNFVLILVPITIFNYPEAYGVPVCFIPRVLVHRK